MQDAQAIAANPMRGADLWEQAILATRFDGSTREGTAFREWKDKEGEALRDKEVQSAIRLHFNWLAITLQKMSGAKNRDLLPAVIQHTKEATAHQLMMEAFEESVKKEKELAASGKHGTREREKKQNDDSVRALNRQLMNEPVASSVVARWLKLDETINDAVPRRNQGNGGNGGTWEASAGNVDGIFHNIILPELREQKDPRLLEYWDVRLKREADNVSKSKLTFEIDKFNTITRPKLLWERAQDIKIIGQRNRALGEMVNLVKTYPTHPDATNWIGVLEQELAPQQPAVPAPEVSAPSSAIPAAAAGATARTP
jgi:hypothetical protein